MRLPTTEDPYFLVCGDALGFLQCLHDNSVDLVITDPPYSSLEKHRAIGTTTRLMRRWFPVLPNDALLLVTAELLRVLKPGRHMYLYCDPETSYALVPSLLEQGWRWGNRLIWDKQRIGMGWHYRRRYEDVLFLWKGPKGAHTKRKLVDKGISDVLSALAPRNGYPTEKPVELAALFCRQSGLQGELVLDPFFGSGSTGAAALQEGLEFLGCDVLPEATKEAAARLEAVLNAR